MTGRKIRCSASLSEGVEGLDVGDEGGGRGTPCRRICFSRLVLPPLFGPTRAICSPLISFRLDRGYRDFMRKR